MISDLHHVCHDWIQSASRWQLMWIFRQCTQWDQNALFEVWSLMKHLKQSLKRSQKLLNWPIQSSRSVTNSGLMMFKLFHVVKNMLLHILLHILPHIAVWHWPTGSLWHLQTEISFGFHREAETSPAWDRTVGRHLGVEKNGEKTSKWQAICGD